MTENEQSPTKPKRHVIVVQDESGSIGGNGILSEVQGGLDTLFKSLREDEAYETTVWLYAFSHTMRTIFADVPATKVLGFEITPGGSTALFDAVGTAVSDHRVSLKKLPVEERPEIVQLVISTDGEENTSQIYPYERRSEVKAMVAKVSRERVEGEDPRLKIHKRGWDVIYLGTGDLTQAVALGVASHSSIAYAANEGGTTPASYAAASGLLSRSASGNREGFTEAERASTRLA